MIKKRRHWRWVTALLVGALLHAGILVWSRFGLDSSAHALSFVLLAQFAAFVVLSAWLVEEIGGHRARFSQVLIGFVLSISMASALGHLFLSPHVESLNMGVLLSWHGLQALPLIACALFRRQIGPTLNLFGLDILVPGLLFLMAPFVLEDVIVSAKTAENGRQWLDWALSVSSWPHASFEVLKVDIFKLELVYREFQIGERMYQFPGSGAAARIQALLAVSLASIGLVLGQFGRLIRRLWTAEESFAEIRS